MYNHVIFFIIILTIYPIISVVPSPLTMVDHYKYLPTYTHTSSSSSFAFPSSGDSLPTAAWSLRAMSATASPTASTATAALAASLQPHGMADTIYWRPDIILKGQVRAVVRFLGEFLGVGGEILRAVLGHPRQAQVETRSEFTELRRHRAYRAV